MNVENSAQEIYDLIIDHSSDYTAESIASSLIKKGVSSEQIIFQSKGTSSRSHKKDVSAIYTTLNEDTNSNLFFLESPREGIYDTLPESIFHSFNGIKSLKNTEAIKEEIKKHREEEKQARLFFLPFEQEFFNIKRTLFEVEDTFDWLSNASSLIDIYTDHYPILSDLPIEKGYLFLRLLPLIHDIRDDFPKIEMCLTMLLDADVRILISFKKNTISRYIPPELGFATLGTNTIIGSIVEDGEPDLDIIITPKNPSEEYDYLFFERQTRLTQQLCDFFIGAQYNVSISYLLSGGSQAFDVTILGYTMCI
jgi:type VI secretion system protein ImpH